ncbi:MAG: acetoacetate--CoA ligase [Gammaproteobacteria bacterium]|nr:acetoacetate--CoA ligase [Gammaproteobacteria bacterium]NND54038.1 acetoacetate--CoA ligase [Gammaproteobacteria bacterium]
MAPIVWNPPADAMTVTPMGRFLSRCVSQYGVTPEYPALYRWSLDKPAEFWLAVAGFTQLRFSSPPEIVFAPGSEMREARWFIGARLNYAENLLRGPVDDVAIIFRDEQNRRQQLTRGQLSRRVRQLAKALQRAGVEPGDRVAAVLPNCPAAVISMLATTAIGAVFSSCSPDFGADAIVDRFGQIGPRVLFVCDGYKYSGKRIDCASKFAEVAARLNDVQHVITVNFLDDAPAAVAGDSLFSDWLGGEELQEFPQFEFAHPLFIMYSSGTTGRPKCIVHGAGGTLLQHAKEHVLHTGLRSGERLFYFTTCGWMMWNWLVGALASGATVVLFDGAPLHPTPDSLWHVIAAEKVTVFGASPRFLQASERAGVPDSSADLSSLHTILSTGAPLPPERYDYLHRLFGDRVQLCSISGGTDLISCFVLGNPLLPVRRGEIQSPGLGMAVDVFAGNGEPLPTGQGELVCTQAFPSMPLGFWNDADGSRYVDAYFTRFPGVWTQGDLAARTHSGGFIISGRSDSVLNPGGVRIGSAEVCAPALSVAGVSDALAAGLRVADDEQIILFVVPDTGAVIDDDCCEKIRAAIRAAASPRHVPARIYAVPDLPRTISGKTSELAVRAAINGEAVANTGALANPEALQYFSDLSAS